MAREQKKLSKQELREDPLMKTIAQTQLWLGKNGKSLMIVGGIVIVVLVVAILMVNSRQQSNMASQAELAKLKSAMVANPDTDVDAQLSDLADTYKGTDGGAEALFTLADKTLGAGDNEKALGFYERFVKSYPHEYMLTSAAYEGEATALANLGRWEEAAEMYDRVSDMKDAAHVKPRMLLEAARCYNKAGEPGKAKERVKSILSDFSSAPEANQAKVMQARLDLEG